MIATVLPSGGSTIGANEAQLGDIYRIFVAGNFNNKGVATITITMFGRAQVITLPTGMTGLKNYSLTYDCLVAAVGTSVTLFASSTFFSGDINHTTTVNLTGLNTVNATASSTLTMTYTAPIGNEMSVYMMYMQKI